MSPRLRLGLGYDPPDGFSVALTFPNQYSPHAWLIRIAHTVLHLKPEAVYLLEFQRLIHGHQTQLRKLGLRWPALREPDDPCYRMHI